TLLGGVGNDTLRSDSAESVMQGGGGFDTADFSSRTKDLVITLDNMANDGEVGEGDNVASDVEKVIGGGGNDRIVGSSAANVLLGLAGNDTLDGGGGNDALFGGSGNDVLI